MGSFCNSEWAHSSVSAGKIPEPKSIRAGKTPIHEVKLYHTGSRLSSPRPARPKLPQAESSTLVEGHPRHTGWVVDCKTQQRQHCYGRDASHHCRSRDHRIIPSEPFRRYLDPERRWQHLHQAKGLRHFSAGNLAKSVSEEQSSAPCSIAKAAR